MIRFNIQPEGFPHEMTLLLGSNIYNVKHEVGNDLRIPSQNIKLVFQGVVSFDYFSVHGH
jgi:hypothetical protein